MVDSVPTFKERVVALGMGAHWPKMEALQWTTHGNFGFATDYVPHQTPIATFRADVVKAWHCAATRSRSRTPLSPKPIPVKSNCSAMILVVHWQTTCERT